MPKNSRTTTTQNWETFYDCISNNLTKDVEDIINKIGDKVHKGEEVDKKSREAKIAAQYGMLYKLKEYGIYIKKAEKDKKPLDLEKIAKVMDQMEGNIFLPVAKSELKWNFSESYRKAMNKFAKMIFQNEKRQVEYATKLQEVAPDLKFTRQELEDLQVPPKVRKTVLPDTTNLQCSVNVFMERLKKLDNNFHINSPSFRGMKSALNKLNETLKKNYVTNDMIAKGVEALQKASMEYIKAKGVGKQSSELGKDRMILAIDICAEASEMMNEFCSLDRMKDIRQQERTRLGYVMSQKETEQLGDIERNEIDQKYEIYKNEYPDLDDRSVSDMSMDDRDFMDDEYEL